MSFSTSKMNKMRMLSTLKSSKSPKPSGWSIVNFPIEKDVVTLGRYDLNEILVLVSKCIDHLFLRIFNGEKQAHFESSRSETLRLKILQFLLDLGKYLVKTT
jgi:hypothetical protein